MNTPAHLLLAAAVLARPGAPRRNAAVLAGAFVPDASLYAMVAWNGAVRGMAPGEIFGRAYFDPFWQGVFAVDNSVFVWGAALVLGTLAGAGALVAFAAAGLLHIATDLPLHHDDGRAHFWPLSDWIFRSPVSYWDGAHHGDVVGLLELALCAALGALLWARFPGAVPRALTAVAVGGLLVPPILFGLVL